MLMSRKSCLAGILPAAALLKPAKRSIRDFYAELACDVMISGVAVGGDGRNETCRGAFAASDVLLSSGRDGSETSCCETWCSETW
jgi:hypothetical protein